MKDDAARLSMSLNGGRVSIQDTLSGDYIHYFNGSFNGLTLDPKVAREHIQTLVEALCTWQRKKKPFARYVVLSSDSKLAVREDMHFQWTLSYRGKTALVHDNMIEYQPQFDIDMAIRTLNATSVILLTADKILTPKRDIVRRIADVGVLCWVSGKHSIVHYESNIDGRAMIDCLVDGKYYPRVIVSASKESETVSLFDPDLNLIITYPIDASILHFYGYDEDLIE